jgi:lysophospholipase L1-like esterase
MPLKQHHYLNLLLTVISLVAVFVLTVCADRLAGRWISEPAPPGAIELIFPPGSEQAFVSSDFEYTAKTNRLGLRDRELATGKIDAYRILAIGDSYTYGWGVDIEEAWVRRLEEALREKGLTAQVVNAGKPGTAPPFFADLAAKAVPLLKPDLVLVTMLQGDDLVGSDPAEVEADFMTDLLESVRWLYPNFVRFIRNARSARQMANDMQPSAPPWKSTAEDNRKWTGNTAKQMLEELGAEARSRFAALDEDVRQAFLQGRLNPHMVKLALQDPGYYELPMNVEDPWISMRIDNLTDHLRRIKDIAARYDAAVAVATVPAGPYVNRQAWKNIQRVGYRATEAMLKSDALDRGVEIACQRAGIPFLTVTEGFREKADESGLFFELDGHFSTAGHARYAELLAPELAALIRKDE